ncbi:MAG: glutathione S-transferase family protein [Gammaproteobacteria bacterium]|nr:glutathione S-transferase family protein [Gammaproteobacteria bacterium]
MKNNQEGEFVRWESSFRSWVTPGGEPGPTGDGGFAAASGRYHLYVSYACPWAHRTLIYRKLKGLEDHISVSVVHPVMPAESWVFGDYPGSTPEHNHGYPRLADLYEHVNPGYDGVVTVPVLYDKEHDVIVNNESSEIIRMLNSAFDQCGNPLIDYYPMALRAEIDEINSFVYENINNGVYKVGFAVTQPAYEKAFRALFSALDELEYRLAQQRYLVGDQITEADWRLFPTLARFDAVYVGHFKCNRNRLVDYPNLWAYTRDLYQQPGVAETVFMNHIKTHYYASHKFINPTGIIPLGPALDFTAAHNRERLTGDSNNVISKTG